MAGSSPPLGEDLFGVLAGQRGAARGGGGGAAEAGGRGGLAGATDRHEGLTGGQLVVLGGLGGGEDRGHPGVHGVEELHPVVAVPAREPGGDQFAQRGPGGRVGAVGEGAAVGTGVGARVGVGEAELLQEVAVEPGFDGGDREVAAVGGPVERVVRGVGDGVVAGDLAPLVDQGGDQGGAVGEGGVDDLAAARALPLVECGEQSVDMGVGTAA